MYISVTSIIALQVLHSMDIAFKNFTRTLGHQGRPMDDHEAHIRTGLTLCSLTKKANAFLGGLIAVEYLVALINVSCNAFFVARYGADIIGEDGELRYQMLLWMINSALYALASGARIYMLQERYSYHRFLRNFSAHIQGGACGCKQTLC